MSSIPLMFPDEQDVEAGGKESITEDFMYRNNVAQASVHIRMGFLRKVYGLLTVQLMLTVVVCSVCMLSTSAKEYISTNVWLVTGAFVLSIIILIALHVKRKESPANFVLLTAFTVVQAYTIGVVITFYDKAAVLQAFALTLVIVLGLTFFTFQTKRDFSFLGIGLFIGLCVLIVGGMLQMIIGSTVLDFVISIGGALLFSVYIIYDTQMLMTKLSAEEYILATINLYLDIVNLFLYILRALEATRR